MLMTTEEEGKNSTVCTLLVLVPVPPRPPQPATVLHTPSKTNHLFMNKEFSVQQTKSLIQKDYMSMSNRNHLLLVCVCVCVCVWEIVINRNRVILCACIYSFIKLYLSFCVSVYLSHLISAVPTRTSSPHVPLIQRGNK